MNRAVRLRIAACGIIGLGAALLIAALLLSTYTRDKITKIPLDIDTTLLSQGRGQALDSASLATEHLVIDEAPILSRQEVKVEAPANADIVTLQVGTSVRRTDKQQESGLLLAMVDRVTLNRSTAMALSDDNKLHNALLEPIFPRKPGDAPDDPKHPKTDTRNYVLLRHEGLSYRFPFNTEKKTYPYFDPIAQKAFDANYEGEEDINGLTAYRFTQNVGFGNDGKLVAPLTYQSRYPGNDDGKVTMSAGMWNLPGDPAEEVTMTRYYAAQRTFWVDPVTGTIVKQSEHAYHYYAREALKPEVTLTDYRVAFTPDTIESQVNAARDERDRLALWTRVLPITFVATGLIALIAGGVLASFSLRTESALIDPGLDRADTDYFRRAGLEEPVPGAEAVTEKLPTQRPELHDEPRLPSADPLPPAAADPQPPESGPASPPESGPTEPPPAGPAERA
ncbi:hypothetical protein BST27_27265 [Mycobacterium intermedium]|uniref:DUF3068 domain-containing protein n=1 Tax=Mycobacterium intermedium TaxID=28445 RepID=A0A1E3S8T3_MYCIE|nr:DUF3068 domain-containing protein [Mycobacterium intermedium]MCV6965076.1 DUF3068 domain-containing protein [Mycobacterium intermedium]ODQ98032.1 hypothetical protein BHQ20_23915 [Mycobacterium intermedium]OPE46238.1 hypothetical protein BV508_26690 [Mycobacterium intermedium]ORA95005.1 hypothetical protein BST27_27265 [Mycobacterium intermedium]